MRHDNFIPAALIIEPRSRGRLPHWQVDNSIYFITFRLRDALPRHVAAQLFVERDHALRSCQTAAQRADLDEAFALRLDGHLDAGYGSCLLREHGETVASALQHFDGSRYNLHAWCVMPNHVHVLLHVQRGLDVPRILHSWKSYTAHVIARGVIWQREYFDRVIRSPGEYAETKAYIHRNPSKAGLRQWPWVG